MVAVLYGEETGKAPPPLSYLSRVIMVSDHDRISLYHQAADGTAPRSFVSSLLQASEEDGGQEYSDDIISSAAALLFAGT